MSILTDQVSPSDALDLEMVPVVQLAQVLHRRLTHVPPEHRFGLPLGQPRETSCFGCTWGKNVRPKTRRASSGSQCFRSG